MLTDLNAVLSGSRPPRFAYNVSSVEGFRAVFEFGEAHDRPMIMQCSERYLLDLGEKYFQAVVVPRLSDSKNRFVLHLDHATSIRAVLRGIRAGFSSVMFDGSALPLEDNIKHSEQALFLCREAEIRSFEAEIGHVGGAEDGDEEEERYFTRIDEAKAFWSRVPVDFLAVSVGNAHGRYHSTPHIQFELLAGLAREVSVPLVLHGGTGIADADLIRATHLGIKKINIGTELKAAWSAGLKCAMDEGELEPDRIRLQAQRFIATAVERLEGILPDGQD